MSEFTQVRLGNSDISVSRFAVGTYHLLDKLDFVSAAESLHAAYEIGINFFDTSDNYPGSEAIIGHAIRCGMPRYEVVIATKTGLATSWYEALDWRSKEKRVDCSPERMRTQLDKSLQSIGIDEIDLYQLHKYDPHIPHAEVAGAMNDFIKDGKIKTWGVSNYSADELEALLADCRKNGLTLPVSSQPYLNLAAGNGSNANKAHANGLTVLAYSPLMKGLLTEAGYQFVSELVRNTADEAADKEWISGVETLGAVRDRAADCSLSLGQFALAYFAQMPSTVVLTAATKPEYLEDVRAAEEAALPDDIELAHTLTRLQQSILATHGPELMASRKHYLAK